MLPPTFKFAIDLKGKPGGHFWSQSKSVDSDKEKFFDNASADMLPKELSIFSRVHFLIWWFYDVEE